MHVEGYILVINKCAHCSVLRDGNLVVGRKGRGCNWALGK